MSPARPLVRQGPRDGSRAGSVETSRPSGRLPRPLRRRALGWSLGAAALVALTIAPAAGAYLYVPFDPHSADTTPPAPFEFFAPTNGAIAEPSFFSSRRMPVVGGTYRFDLESGIHYRSTQVDGVELRREPRDDGRTPEGPPLEDGWHWMRVVIVNGAGLWSTSEPLSFYLSADPNDPGVAESPPPPPPPIPPTNLVPPAPSETAQAELASEGASAPTTSIQGPTRPASNASGSGASVVTGTPGITVGPKARGRIIEVRARLDGRWHRLRVRAGATERVALPARLAGATSLRWRIAQSRSWRASAPAGRAHVRRREEGKAYLARVGAAAGSRIQLRYRLRGRLVVATRKVRPGRRVGIPGAARSTRWRPAPQPWQSSPSRSAAGD
jgi:hypothetical protein